MYHNFWCIREDLNFLSPKGHRFYRPARLPISDADARPGGRRTNRTPLSSLAAHRVQAGLGTIARHLPNWRKQQELNPQYPGGMSRFERGGLATCPMLPWRKAENSNLNPEGPHSFPTRPAPCAVYLPNMAESVRFELTLLFRVSRFSKPVRRSNFADPPWCGRLESNQQTRRFELRRFSNLRTAA